MAAASRGDEGRLRCASVPNEAAVLVLGASGGIGSAVCSWLLRNTGFSVLAQVRRASQVDALRTRLGEARAEFLVGNPGEQEFWSRYADTMVPPALRDPEACGCRLDERVYLVGSPGPFAAPGGSWRMRRLLSTFSGVEHPERHVVAVACCTGNLLIKPLSDTTPDDASAAMAAHVAPLILAIRNLGCWNKRAIFFACGSDPLSTDGSVDCGTYVMAKFAQRGLLACAREELPHATFRETLLPNTRSGLWAGAGLEAPDGSVSVDEAAEMLVGEVEGLYNKVQKEVALAFDV